METVIIRSWVVKVNNGCISISVSMTHRSYPRDEPNINDRPKVFNLRQLRLDSKRYKSI